jgi:hypothetical protein
MAFGNADGHFQPCGCDPKTDLGGMLRLGGMVQRVRLSEPDSALFYVGNVSSKEKGFDYDATSITKAVAELEPSAITVALEELGSIDLMDKKFKEQVVITNSTERLPVMKRKQSGQGWQVLGFVTTPKKADKDLIPLTSSFLKTLSSEKAKSPTGFTFCLAAVTASELKTIAMSKICDRIIAAPFEASQTKLGKIDDSVLMPKKFKNVMVVPHSAQGVLRGGKALDVQMAAISDLLGKNNCTSSVDKIGGCGSVSSLRLSEPVIWLESRFAEDSPIKAINEEYEKGKVDEFKRTANERLQKVDASFVGAETCKTCHPAAYDAWTKTKHANAFATLQAKQKHQDIECVICHVVGHEGKSAFASIETTSKMINVQCENCHGPRAEHVRNPEPAKKSAATKVCVTCHRDQHSPEFKFQTYWDRIKH